MISHSLSRLITKDSLGGFKLSSIPTLLDIKDVAAALRVSTYTVRRWASQKKLPRIKLGSRTLFTPDAVAKFIEQARNISGGNGRKSVSAGSHSETK